MATMRACCCIVLVLISVLCVSANPLKYKPTIRRAHVLESGTGQFLLRDGITSRPKVAEIEYELAVNKTGWSYVYGWTNGSASNVKQAYTIGYLEAKIDPLLKMQFHNTVQGQCRSATTSAFCKKLESFLVININFMKSQILQKRTTDPFWHQVELMLWQVVGMDDAFKHLPMRPAGDLDPSKLFIDPFGMYLWQIAGGDMDELGDALLPQKEREMKYGGHSVKVASHCSGLVKRLPNMGDVLVSQDTWSGYQSMLRHMKLYEFNFRQTAAPNSPPLPGGTQSFSSYPGSITSGDDFYVLGSNLVTFETTNGFYNSSLYKIIRDSAGKMVFEFLRTQVANRLANSISDWQKQFAKFNSGTYNNQWVIVDHKKVTKGAALPSSGVLGVSEQIPGLVVSGDMTQHLKQTTYWPSYNTPYFSEIYRISDFASMVKKFGNFFDYNQTARARIFRRDHGHVTDIESMIRLMRYNNFKHDPLSVCDCKPPYTAEYAIAARCDLNDPNGTYPFSALGHRNHGATDMKLAVPALMNDVGFIGISSPTYDQQPPFRWSTSGLTIPHMGHPDLWKFPPIQTPWRRIRHPDPKQKSFVLHP